MLSNGLLINQANNPDKPGPKSAALHQWLWKCLGQLSLFTAVELNQPTNKSMLLNLGDMSTGAGLHVFTLDQKWVYMIQLQPTFSRQMCNVAF